MLTFREAASAVGLRPTEFRNRFEAIRDVLETRDYLRTGAHNGHLFTQDAIVILRQMQDMIAQEGRTITEAAEIIRAELGVGPHEKTPSYATTQELRILAAKLNELKERVATVEENLDLHITPLHKRMLSRVSSFVYHRQG